MKTITCRGNQVSVVEVAKVSGFLDTQNSYEETLYRDNRGQYYLEEVRVQLLRPDMPFTLPRDEEKLKRYQMRHSRLKQVSDKAAMMWFIERNVVDEGFQQMFTWMIVGTERPASNVIVAFPQPELALQDGGVK